MPFDPGSDFGLHPPLPAELYTGICGSQRAGVPETSAVVARAESHRSDLGALWPRSVTGDSCEVCGVLGAAEATRVRPEGGMDCL